MSVWFYVSCMHTWLIIANQRAAPMMWYFSCGENFSPGMMYVVVFVFTLNRAFYPTTSAVPPVSFLILHTGEIQILWSRWDREETNAEDWRWANKVLACRMKTINAIRYGHTHHSIRDEIAARLTSSTFICSVHLCPFLAGSLLRFLSVLRLVSAFHLPAAFLYSILCQSCFKFPVSLVSDIQWVVLGFIRQIPSHLMFILGLVSRLWIVFGWIQKQHIHIHSHILVHSLSSTAVIFCSPQ